MKAKLFLRQLATSVHTAPCRSIFSWIWQWILAACLVVIVCIAAPAAPTQAATQHTLVTVTQATKQPVCPKVKLPRQLAPEDKASVRQACKQQAQATHKPKPHPKSKAKAAPAPKPATPKKPKAHAPKQTPRVPAAFKMHEDAAKRAIYNTTHPKPKAKAAPAPKPATPKKPKAHAPKQTPRVPAAFKMHEDAAKRAIYKAIHHSKPKARKAASVQKPVKPTKKPTAALRRISAVPAAFKMHEDAAKRAIYNTIHHIKTKAHKTVPAPKPETITLSARYARRLGKAWLRLDPADRASIIATKRPTASPAPVPPGTPQSNAGVIDLGHPYLWDWWNRDRECYENIEVTFIDPDGHTHCHLLPRTPWQTIPSSSMRGWRQVQPSRVVLGPGGTIVLMDNGTGQNDESGAGQESSTQPQLPPDISEAARRALERAGEQQARARRYIQGRLFGAEEVPDIVSVTGEYARQNGQEFIAPQGPPYPADAPLLRSGHAADVRYTNTETGEVAVWAEVSGKTTDEQRSVGFPRWLKVADTEVKAMSRVPLDSHSDLEIVSRQGKPPCRSCQLEMRRVWEKTGANITYRWIDESGVTWVWHPNQEPLR